MSGLRVADFDFALPPELIAQEPPAERGQSRMLVMSRATGALRDASFAELPALLNPGDLLVLNDTRVIPARLYARRTLRREREKPTGRIEVMLTEPVAPQKPRIQMMGGPGLDSETRENIQLGAPGPNSGAWKHTAPCPIHSVLLSGMGGKPRTSTSDRRKPLARPRPAQPQDRNRRDPCLSRARRRHRPRS